MSQLFWTLERAAEWLQRYQTEPMKDLAGKEGKRPAVIIRHAHKLYARYPQLRPARGKYRTSLVDPLFLVAHYNKDMSRAQIAALYLMTEEGLYKVARRYKDMGFEIHIQPHHPTHPEGYVRTKQVKGKALIRQQKINGKWVTIPDERKPRIVGPTKREIQRQEASERRRQRQERQAVEHARIKAEQAENAANKAREREAKEQAALQEKIKKAVMKKHKQRKPPRESRKVSHDINPEKIVIKSTEGMRLVRVDVRTEIYAKPGETDQQVIDRYHAKRSAA